MSQSLLKIVADFTVQLSSPVAIGDTTATLTSATDDDSVSLPSGLYGLTIDLGQSNKEYIICTLTGTALTDIKSVTRQGVVTTGFARSHRRGAKVSITDWVILKRILDNLNGTTGFDSSVNLGYDGAPTGLTGNQFATVNYVLSVVNGGTVTFDKQVISSQTAGENLTVNDVVYFKESDQRWYKADADLTATFEQLQIGIAQSTVTTGNTTQIAISGPISGFTGLTAGSKYYLSNTAGAITTTAGTYSVFLGWALSTTSLLFNPVLKTLPTQKEKDAMAGSTGVPSSNNKFVTQDNTTSATTDQTQTTQNGTVEVGEANATTKKNKIAQSFIPTKTKIRGVKLYKSADLGTFTGTITVSLQADNSGSPSGSALATKTLTNLNWTALPVGEIEFLFTSEYTSLTTGSLYWIVIETSTSDNSNHPNVGINTAGGYANGSVKYNNSTDSWTAVATIDLYFKTLEGNISQEAQTDTSGFIPNSLMGYTTTSLRNLIGAGDSSNSGWVNFQIPFITATGLTLWTGALGSGDIDMRMSHATTETGISINGAYAITSNPIYFSMTEKFIVDFTAILDPSAQIVVGFTNTNLGSGHGYGTNTSRITFDINAATGKLYASMANGSARSEKEIGGITLSNKNKFRIEVDTVNSTASYYVNGVLQAVNTTNFPSSLTKFAFGVGTNTSNGTSSYSVPSFSIET